MSSCSAREMMRHVFVIALMMNLIQAFNLQPQRKSVFNELKTVSLCKSIPQPTQVGKTSVLKMGLLDGMKKEDSKAEVKAKVQNAKAIDKYQKRVDKINAMEEEIEALSDEELKAKTAEFKVRVASGETLDSVLEEAFAVVREAAWRVLELRHYDVQLIGGMVLSEGKLAEMATGEGKTLVATLPTYLNALSGKGAYVVTANDYLAKRDSDLMGQVHRFLGLSVGLIQSTDDSPSRRKAYACDVTYLTNAELGFDYLRDNLAMTEEEVVQGRPFNFCLVDEADSILIDEARTPLIISKQVDAPKVKFETSAKIADILERDFHYTVDEKGQNVIFTEQGMDDCSKVVKKSIFDVADPWAPYISNALKAKELFENGKEYLVRDGEVVIVDQFSGRVLEGRRYSDGLHQSIEAKEGLVVTKQSQVIATVTYQSLFKSFPILAGMSGTAKTEEFELEDIYNLEVLVVPTALPIARRDYDDVVYRTKEAKINALLGEVERVNELGEPVLIGTTSVEDSEMIAAELRELDIECEVLNAKPENIDKESEIVAQAGRMGKVTVATNMAGRGTDILLGGNPSMMAKIQLRNALAEKLLSSEEFAKIPKVSKDFYPSELSAEAKILFETGVAAVTKAYKGKENVDKDMIEEIIAVASEAGPSDDLAVLALRDAFYQMKEEYGAVLKEEKAKILKLGGLYVMGTEKHESRRIDNQLRGRAGRQGDPGGSRFFLSLEDDTFRLFGGDRIEKLMQTFRLGDDIPLEAKQVTDALTAVQEQVEEYFSGIRRQVFDYDEVLNSQRQAVYSRRGAILSGTSEDINSQMKTFCRDTVDEIVPGYIKEDGVDASGLAAKIKQFFNTVESLDEKKMTGLKKDELIEYLHAAVDKALDVKNAQLDSTREGMAVSVMRYLTLVNYDNLWQAHLQQMDQMKNTAGLNRFAGQDPLDIYKIEGFKLFQGLFNNVKLNTVYSYFIYNPQQQAS